MTRAIFLLLISLGFFSCDFARNRIRGNGSVKSETRKVESFKNIDVSGNIQVYLSQDSASTVKVETDENLLSHVVIETDDETLEISPENGTNLVPSGKIRVFVSNRLFEKLHASGASGIFTQQQISSDDIVDIDISGASEADLSIHSPRTEAELSGASHITLRGQTRNLVIDAAGASSVKGFDLLSENADVDISGASHAEVYASTNLEADASGASHIRYKGKPTTKKINASGAGSVTEE